MNTLGNLQKAFLYIIIQIATLWTIFYQLTTERGQEGKFEVIGTLILISVLLLYAYKTIRILKTMQRESEEKEHLQHS